MTILTIYWIDDNDLLIYDDIEKWCDETYGQNNWHFSCDVERIEYIFTNESDLSLFLLKWPQIIKYCDF